MLKSLVTLLSVLILSACVSAPPPAPGTPDFQTQIRWTSYGIPHVKADDWAGLGYGFAYATATDGVCVIARDVMTVNGELSKYLGAEDGNLESDIFYRGMLTSARLEAYTSAQSNNDHEYSRGYVAGFNRYLRDHKDNLPASCAGQKWMNPIVSDDLVRMNMGLGIRYGLGWFQKDIAHAAPPGEETATVDLKDLSAVAANYDFEPGIGSNAIALGSDVTETGRGILFGNPHYPWQGASRFHMIHTTIPGQLDVMGASLMATSRVGIGFNKDVAWSHTVSSALRFTLYQLELNPDNPLEYRYGNEYRPIVKKELPIEVLGANGVAQQQTHSMYLSHYGPIAMSKALPWDDKVAYAIRDANVNNARTMATWDALAVASSIDEVEAAISLHGLPWVNTIAADRHGTAFYADISVTPNVDAQLLERCRLTVANLPAQLVVLSGEEPDCEWKSDKRSAIPGALPADDMPRLRRQDYVTNSNDSYWLTNPEQPLEGFSPIIGPERTARTLRTRAGLNFLQEALAQKGSLGPEDLQTILYSQRNYGAEILLDDVLSLCDADNVGISRACTALQSWDRRQTNDSRGAQVWTEFWRTAQNIPNVYAVPFNVDDPANTPTGIAVKNQEVGNAVHEALANAQTTLDDAGIALDARWGEVQFAERNGERIAIPGGQGWAGMFSMIMADLQKDKGYTPIIHGNSFIQVISWDDDGELNPQGMLTYSQSQEPDSEHYDDLTRLYSKGQWITFPFTEAAIQADPELRKLELSE